MRLTLRTLLAYLDDRLPPSNAREIGQKIAGSPFATELVQRIREVVRRRRLAEPEQRKPLLDANLVAEYLDDQLTPELVARIEREILQSDVSLAEVAATHEILGLLRDPVELEPRLRDRLYALDPSGKLEVVRSLSPSDGTAPASNPAPAEWKPLSTRVGTSRRLPVIIMSVLAVIWVALIATDEFLFRGTEVAQNNQQGAAAEKSEVNRQEGSGDVEQVAVVDDTNTSSVTDGKAEETVVTPKETRPDDSAQAATGIEMPVVEEPNPAANADTASLPADSVPAVQQPVPVVPGTEPDVANPSVHIEDDLQMTLLLDSSRSDVADLQTPVWKLAAKVAGDGIGPEQLKLLDWFPVIRDQWLGVSAPFKTGMRSGTWKAKIAGPALIRHLSDRISGLEILEGRLVVQPDPTVELREGESSQFLLRTGATTNVITFSNVETKLSIEVIAGSTSLDDVDAVAAPHPALLPVTSDLYISMFVMEGAIRVRTEGTEEEAELQRSQILTWKVLPRGGISDVQLGQARPQEGLPDWAFVIDAPPVADQLEAETELVETLRTSAELNASAEQLSTSKNPQVAVMSTQLLSTVRDVDRLANIFLQSTDELSRRAAVDGLSRIAIQTPAGQSNVREVFENRFPMSDVPMVLQLIVGVTDAQAGDPEFCARMVGLLSNDRVATRDLALYRMESFTKDRFGFHADGDPGRRRDAVRRWLKHLERNGGKLLP